MQKKKKKKKKKLARTCKPRSEVVNDFLLQSDPTSTIRPAFFFSWRFGHENISTAILPLQKEHLAVDGARMFT